MHVPKMKSTTSTDDEKKNYQAQNGACVKANSATLQPGRRFTESRAAQEQTWNKSCFRSDNSKGPLLLA